MSALWDGPLDEGHHRVHKRFYKPFIAPPGGDWRPRGACTGLPTEAFIPDKYRGKPEVEAKKVCNGSGEPGDPGYRPPCPVKELCAEHAIVNNEVGLWGGLTEFERRKIRRDRKLAETGDGGRMPPPPPHHSEARARWINRFDQPPCLGCLDAAALANRERRAAKRAVARAAFKTCSDCGARKPGTEFNTKSANLDGLQRNCRRCQRAAYRRWYDEHGRKLRAEGGR